MIEMQEDEHSRSVFTDDELRDILMLCGPKVKDLLLLPCPVPLQHKLAANE
jgi:hypothetical protein